MQVDQMIGIVSTVTVKAGRDDEYYQVVIDLIKDHSTQEPDCIDIIVHRGVDDPTRIMLYERWRIPRDRFVPEQMSKSFIVQFTERTRDMVVAEEEITFWSATDLVTGGMRTALPGRLEQAD